MTRALPSVALGGTTSILQLLRPPSSVDGAVGTTSGNPSESLATGWALAPLGEAVCAVLAYAHGDALACELPSSDVVEPEDPLDPLVEAGPPRLSVTTWVVEDCEAPFDEGVAEQELVPEEVDAEEE